jgi:hypothetical protein
LRGARFVAWKRLDLWRFHGVLWNCVEGLQKPVGPALPEVSRVNRVRRACGTSDRSLARPTHCNGPQGQTWRARRRALGHAILARY